MKTWAPLNCKTHFSLLKGFSRCDQLIAKCKEYGYTACGIADIKTISGAVDFHQNCKKQGIKPILGCDFEDFILYAKNAGFGKRSLIQIRGTKISYKRI